MDGSVNILVTVVSPVFVGILYFVHLSVVMALGPFVCRGKIVIPSICCFVKCFCFEI